MSTLKRDPTANTSPRGRRDGIHTARVDYDTATDLHYMFKKDRFCGVRIEDSEPVERVAKKLRHFAALIEEGALK